jgi:parvulin-like peptidyl-prolyl isomerase
VKRFLLLLLAGLVLLHGCGKKEEPVAVVGDMQIAAADFQRVLARKMRLWGKQTASDAEKRRLLDELVDRKLLLAEGTRRGIVPTSAEVDAAVAKAKAGFPNEAEFNKSLQEDGLDEAGLRKETKENLLVAKVENRLAANVISEEGDARRYYAAHREDFATPTSYRVYLIHPGSSEESALALSKYRSHAAEFDRFALKQGDPELRSINHNAVLTPEGNFPDEMIPFLKKMKVSEVAGPVKTGRGYFIFHLLEKTSGHQKSWDQAKGEVIHLLYQEKKQEAVQKWLTGQRQGIKIRVGRL